MALFLFVSRYYLKYFLIILAGLEMFFVGIDSIKYVDNFPDSANVLILYFFYGSLYALNYTLPISLLLSSIYCYVMLVRTYQYCALLSLGYSKRAILFPIFSIATIISFLYVALNATPFAYAKEKADDIIYKGSTSGITKDLLIRHGSSYVYFESINPLLQVGSEIKVFNLNHSNLSSFIQSQEAFFEGNSWFLKRATVGTMPKNMELSLEGLVVEEKDNLEILEGFRPKILDTIYQTKPSVSIVDIFESLLVLSRQNLNSDRIRAMLYNFVLTPFFVPFAIVVMAFYVPPMQRYGNLFLLGFAFVIFSLATWGMFFSLGKLSIGGLFYPELGTMVPFCLLLAVSIFHYYNFNNKP